MNSYAVAFGILGLGVFLAGLLWSIPRIRRHRHVVRFRKALTHLDTVAVSWSQALRQNRPQEDVPTALPEHRHSRRHPRRGHTDDGDAAVA